ncbi:hypothetical protein YC2023_011075 [Brassica napus]
MGANCWGQNRSRRNQRRKISLRERLLKASDNGSQTAKHPSSNSPNGRVGLVQLAKWASWID